MRLPNVACASLTWHAPPYHGIRLPIWQYCAGGELFDRIIERDYFTERQVLLHILMIILAVGLPCIVAICAVLGVRSIGVETIITQAVVLLVAVVPIANQARAPPLAPSPLTPHPSLTYSLAHSVTHVLAQAAPEAPAASAVRREYWIIR